MVLVFHLLHIRSVDNFYQNWPIFQPIDLQYPIFWYKIKKMRKNKFETQVKRTIWSANIWYFWLKKLFFYWNFVEYIEIKNLTPKWIYFDICQFSNFYRIILSYILYIRRLSFCFYELIVFLLSLRIRTFSLQFLIHTGKFEKILSKPTNCCREFCDRFLPIYFFSQKNLINTNGSSDVNWTHFKFNQ